MVNLDSIKFDVNNAVQNYVDNTAVEQTNKKVSSKIDEKNTTLSNLANLPDSTNKYKTTVKQVSIDDLNANQFQTSTFEVNNISEDEYNNLDDKSLASKSSFLGFNGYANANYIPDETAGEDSLSRDSNSDIQIFELPDWGIEDYINDRTKWIKGVRSVGDEPGWFYFKVFFKFNTNYGLFGSCLKTNKRTLISSNTALRYLNNFVGTVNGEPLYKQEQIPMRINALIRFAQGLSKINSHYPWMIKGVTGLDQAMNSYTDKFSEEKSIELIFNNETTDMKLISLLNLYKYACYDDFNCKEIIPENLRKFDMMIVVYHVPIKYFQTAIMVSPKKNLSTGVLGSLGGGWAKAESIINKTFNFLTTKSTYYKYKRMAPQNEDYSNMMSFQMFTFQNCEFDVSSFGKYFEGAEMKNEQSFQFTETPIKIKYDRVFFHNMNEWNQMLFGSDGFWYDKNFVSKGTLSDAVYNNIKGNGKLDNFKNRLQSLKQAREGAYFYDKNAEQYKSLIEYSESLITDGLMSMEMKDYYSFIDGNIYGKYGSKQSEYFKDKLDVLKNGNIRGNLYGKLIGPSHDGGYFTKKIQMIKNGTIAGNMYEKLIRPVKEDAYFTKKLERIHKGTVSGNMFGKVLGREGIGGSRKNSDYLSTKLHWLNDGAINDNGVRILETDENGTTKVKGELTALFNDAKQDEYKLADNSQLIELFNASAVDGWHRTIGNDDDPFSTLLSNLFNETPDSPYERDPVQTKKKEIWNYALTGSSKSSSIGGALDAAQSIVSFWKW